MSRRSKENLAVKAALNILKRTGKQMPLVEWIEKRDIHIKTPGGYNRFSFDGHDYLREIYELHHRDEVIEKAAQVCISTYFLLKSLWLCDTCHAKVIYFFPTDTDVSDFSNDRAKPMIEGNEYLSSKVSEIDNVGLKQLGDSSIYFRGMFSKTRVKSVDADYIVLDELDEARQDHKEFAKDRILHSALRWIAQLSQPSIPDYGIDAEFQESDQRFFHLKCPSCGHWNCLEETFPECFFERKPSDPKYPGEKYYRGCVKCAAELDMSQGSWIAKYPSRADKRGYHLSQLFSSLRTADELIKPWHKARRTPQKLRYFNSILGFPYSGDNQPVTDAILDLCERDYVFELTGRQSFMGVDQGDMLHIVIGTCEGPDLVRIHHLESTPDWNRLHRLMELHNVRACVIDALPNKRSAKDFALAFRGRVWIQYFKAREKESEEEDLDGALVPVVQVDRTESLDETTSMLARQEIILPSSKRLMGIALETLEEFRKHTKMLIKDLAQDAHGNQRWVYKKRVENHFGMALNSLRVGTVLSPVMARDPFAESYAIHT